MIAPMTPQIPADAFDWPTFGLADDVRPALKRAQEQGRPAALATLFAVEGGAPRGVGAQMLVADGEIAGFLSGGCVEADVAGHALQALADGRSRRLIYGEGGPPDVRLACGSRIEILVEALAPGDPAARALIALGEARRPAFWLSDGEVRACLEPSERGGGLSPALRRLMGAKGLCAAAESPFAIHRRFLPPPRLVVVGSDPIALALLSFAAVMGLEAALVRPKGPSTAPEVAVCAYLRTSPAEAMAALRPDPWTAIAVFSHEADVEHDALKAALATDAGYIGALGSRRRIPEREQRLIEAGATAQDLDRIRAPIGLPIGGKSPAEIAVAVLAEIVAERAEPDDG